LTPARLARRERRSTRGLHGHRRRDRFPILLDQATMSLSGVERDFAAGDDDTEWMETSTRDRSFNGSYGIFWRDGMTTCVPRTVPEIEGVAVRLGADHPSVRHPAAAGLVTTTSGCFEYFGQNFSMARARRSETSPRHGHHGGDRFDGYAVRASKRPGAPPTRTSLLQIRRRLFSSFSPSGGGPEPLSHITAD